MTVFSAAHAVLQWLSMTVETIWMSSTTQVDALDASIVVWCAILAFTAVLVNPIWSIARNAITIAHEAGHAIVALCTGRRLQSIQLHSDTSGVTVSSGKRSGPGLMLTTFAGYAAPALWGLGCAALSAAGYATGALWLLVVLLVLLLSRIRNGYGLLSIITAIVLVIGLSWWGSGALRAQAAYTLAWFLCFGSIRPVMELQHQRMSHNVTGSDADQLARETGVPATVWVIIWIMLDILVLWLAADWMTQDGGGVKQVLSDFHMQSLFADVFKPAA